MRYQNKDNTTLLRKDFVSFGLLGVAVLSGALLTLPSVSADVVDMVNITVPISCSISSIGENSHNAEIINGQINSSIGETTIKAFCNDNEGFAIYAVGYTDNEIGKNVLTNSTLGNTHEIETGTATNGSTSNWAMKLSTITTPAPQYPIIITGTMADTLRQTSDPDFSSFTNVPNEYKKVAYRTSATDINPEGSSTAEGSILKTTYQVYISPTQVAGEYTGQVKYTMIHPAYANAYGCNPSGNTIEEILCMQDVNSTNKSTVLASMTLEQQYTLKDKRDNKTYTVAKLKDNNIWMTQNLDLDIDANTTYTNEDTDLGWNGSSYSTASWTPMRSTYATGDRRWCEGGIWNTQYNYCDDNYTPESYDPGDLYWNDVLDTTSSLRDWSDYIRSCTFNLTTKLFENCNEALNPTSLYITDRAEPQYRLGNYYNWTAAVAMNDSSTYTTYGQNVDQSICPRGWTLPKGGEVVASPVSGSFQNLFEQYGWNDDSYEMIDNARAYEAPFYFILGGIWWNGIIYNAGGDGYHWSSTVLDDEISYDNYVYSGPYVFPEDTSNDRGNGISVRCLAR